MSKTKHIRGEICAVHRFLWKPVTICRDRRWLRFAYLKLWHNGGEWQPVDFLPSDVGKAQVRLARTKQLVRMAYKFQSWIFSIFKKAAWVTNYFTRRHYDLACKIYKLEAEYAPED